MQRGEAQREGDQPPQDRAQAEVGVGQVDAPAQVRERAFGAALDGVVAHRAGRPVRCRRWKIGCACRASRSSGSNDERPSSESLRRAPAGSRSARDPSSDSGEAHDMVTGERRERRAALGRRGAATVQLAPRPPQLPAQPPREVRGRERLAPAVDLAQAAPLVEAAAQLLGGRVGVGVQDGRVGDVGPRVAGAQHVDREQPILGVGDLAERRALPGGARDAGVGVGEEPARADQRERGQGAHARARPGDPRAARRRARASETSAPVPGAPPVRRPGGAGRDRRPDPRRRRARTRRADRSSQRASAGLASCVSSATCAPEASLISRLRVPPWLKWAGSISITRAPCQRASSAEPSRRAGIAHEQLVRDRLRGERAQRAREKLAAIADGDRDGYVRHDRASSHAAPHG